MPLSHPMTGHRRRLVALAGVTAVSVLAGAAPAMADTRVSLETGDFGNALRDSRVVSARDIRSVLHDEDVDVAIRESGGFIFVEDTNGDTKAGSGCTEVSGDEIRCSTSGVDGIYVEGSNRSDSVRNFTGRVTVNEMRDGSDTVFGSDARDDLLGDAGADQLDGQSGDDFFVGGPGRDVLRGGPGEDLVSYNDFATGVTVTFDGVANDGDGDNVDNFIENVRGTAGNDHIVGSDARNVLVGLGGGDILEGGAGDDVLAGREGADLHIGGAGSDTASYSERTAGVVARIDGGDGSGNADDGPMGARDTIEEDVENLAGGAGPDQLFSQFQQDVANRLTGNGGEDRLEGDGGDDRLDGGVGPDVLLGGNGADSLDGGGDADTMDGGFGSDVIFGSSGSDLAVYPRSEDIDVTLTSDPLNRPRDDGGAGDGPEGARDDLFLIERVTTGSGGDTVIGDVVAETIDTGAGDDTLIGNGGGDRLTGGPGRDRFDGGSGIDALLANDGVKDTPISCGGDDDDRFDGDLQDAEDDQGRFQLGDCDIIQLAAVGELPNVRVTGLRLDRAGRVSLRCSRAVKTGRCRGQLSVAVARGKKPLATRSYSLRRGARATVRLHLSRAGARRLLRRGRILVVATGRDRTGRPTTTEAFLRIAKQRRLP